MKHPCRECFIHIEGQDKNCAECLECDERIAYVEHIEGLSPGKTTPYNYVRLTPMPAPTVTTIPAGATRGMYARGNKLENIRNSLLSGNGIRKTARILGVSKCTVGKCLKLLLASRRDAGAGDIMCRCGQASTHQGWCWYRFKESPKRQQFMKRWHGQNVLG